MEFTTVVQRQLFTEKTVVTGTAAVRECETHIFFSRAQRHAR